MVSENRINTGENGIFARASFALRFSHPLLKKRRITALFLFRVAFKDEVNEVEQIRRSVDSILRKEQRKQQPRRAQDMEL